MVNISTTLYKGLFVCVIIVSEAFDSVDHGLLLSKLSQYGSVSSILKWFKFNYCIFLIGPPCTVIAGTKSQPVPITAGVLQGSVLVPNCFQNMLYNASACCSDCSYHSSPF